MVTELHAASAAADRHNSLLPVSYGLGPYGRVYEKLRKQSYRSIGFVSDDGSEDWTVVDHRAYIYGVREALSELVPAS